MSKKQEPTGQWNFQLNKLVGKGEGLKDPLGYRVPVADIVVKNSAGKKNLTQIEVLESVSISSGSSLIIMFRKHGSSQSHHRNRS